MYTNQEPVSYADFIFVSMLHFVKCISEDLFKKLLALDDAFPEAYEASKQWLEKED
jgi:hypothetical protein